MDIYSPESNLHRCTVTTEVSRQPITAEKEAEIQKQGIQSSASGQQPIPHQGCVLNMFFNEETGCGGRGPSSMQDIVSPQPSCSLHFHLQQYNVESCHLEWTLRVAPVSPISAVILCMYVASSHVFSKKNVFRFVTFLLTF